MCDVGDIASGASDVVVKTSDLMKQYANEASKFYAGYDIEKKSFNIKNFQVVHGADEFIGEISGRNMAREQIARQGAALEQERITRQEELANERKQAQQQDIQASQTTGALRLASAAQSQRYLGTSTGANPERDFMGL